MHIYWRTTSVEISPRLVKADRVLMVSLDCSKRRLGEQAKNIECESHDVSLQLSIVDLLIHLKHSLMRTLSDVEQRRQLHCVAAPLTILSEIHVL
jgi:hypothetical protein